MEAIRGALACPACGLLGKSEHGSAFGLVRGCDYGHTWIDKSEQGKEARAMTKIQAVTVTYGRKLSDGNYGSEDAAVSVTFAGLEALDAAGYDAITKTAWRDLRAQVLGTLALSESPQVRRAAERELRGPVAIGPTEYGKGRAVLQTPDAARSRMVAPITAQEEQEAAGHRDEGARADSREDLDDVPF